MFFFNNNTTIVCHHFPNGGLKEEYFSAKEIDYIFGVYKNLALSTELIM